MQARRTTDAGESLNPASSGKSSKPNQVQTETSDILLHRTELGHIEARHFLLEDYKQDYRQQIDQLNTEKHSLQVYLHTTSSNLI